MLLLTGALLELQTRAGTAARRASAFQIHVRQATAKANQAEMWLGLVAG